jgi:uncharacterized phage protein (TIGR01671 family)
MREIKFRAWDTNDKTMIMNPLGFPELYPLKSLMQFTGLKDKYGKDIYEGDIVKIHNTQDQVQLMELICVVECEKIFWNLVVKKINSWERYSVYPPDIGHQINFGNIAFTKQIKVIGNIHENPELLLQEVNI